MERGIVTPIYKKGDRNNPANYRAIVVGSNLGKLYSAVLNNRLVRFIEARNLIPHNQIGYRKGFRTSDHIATLKTLIDKTFSEKRKLYCCFIDFKNAFPSVSRPLLFYKLLESGIGGNFLRSIQSMYDDVQLSIRIEGGISDSFEVKSGVKQGCTLSPNLFNIFTRDLPDSFIDCDPVFINDNPISCLMYADDTILLSNSAAGLQRALNHLHAYCSKWSLSVNESKSQVMIFNARGLTLGGEFKYGGRLLEVVSDYVYLGINFKPSGVFTSACYRLMDSARRAMFKIRSFCYGAPISVALSLFDCLVSPIITYGGEIWSPYLFKKLNTDNFKSICDKFIGETLAIKFYRSILGVNKTTSNDAVRGELGRHPLLLSSVQHSTKYLEDLIKNPRSELLKNILTLSASLDSSWVNILQKILTICDIEISANDIVDGNLPEQEHNRRISNVVGEKLRLIYNHQWRQIINNIKVGPVKGNEKLRTYCTFKDCFCLEPYLLNHNFKSRRNLTKLRTSAHKLEIETGRHKKPFISAELRWCKCCNLEVAEDEYHFIMTCPRFTTQREKLWADLGEFCDFRGWSASFKFKFIMTGGMNDSEILGHIFTFLDSIWLLRF